jgi:PEP-CTERM motif
MKSLVRKTLLSAVLATLILSCSSMKAQARTVISDNFRVFDQNHQEVYSKYVTKEQEDLNGIGTLYYIEADGLADPNQWGNYTSVLKAPDYQVMSDAFGAIYRGTDLLLFFQSDTSTEPCPFPLGPNIVFETLQPTGRYGGIFDATMYLSPDLQAQGWTADFESGMSVPEPATVILMGSGIGALFLLKRSAKSS